MANDEMQAQTKPRISPLEYRNTDLVSRLLAATPPYLYNMSMIPNTYFFSEMLRSFVQAKTDRNSGALARKSRKRSWTQTKSAEPSHKSHKPLEDHNWKTDTQLYDDNKVAAIQQESVNFNDFKDRDSYSILFPPPPPGLPSQQPPQNHSHTQQQTNENSSNLILPPPPPIWYPPLYSTTPYGIDPLHFFIDLRVSGHIYDRKKSLEKEESSEMLNAQTTNAFSDISSSKPANVFKTSKHASAFTVPLKNHPINLSKVEDFEHKPLKFDVKSLGLETICNKTGLNYVMNNIDRVYKDLQESSKSHENLKSEGEKEVKKKQELREWIGLEIVADYMSYNKKGFKNGSNAVNDTVNDEITNEIDSGSVVEVVDIQDDPILET